MAEDGVVVDDYRKNVFVDELVVVVVVVDRGLVDSCCGNVTITPNKYIHPVSLTP